MTEITFSRQIDLSIDASSETHVAEIDLEALVVPVAHDGAFVGLAKAVDAATGSLLSQLVADGELANKNAAVTLVHRPAGVVAKKVVLVRFPDLEGAGQPEQLVYDAIRAGAGAASKAAKAGKSGYIYPEFVSGQAAGGECQRGAGSRDRVDGLQVPGTQEV